MPLEIAKLEKVKTSNGKTIARCPACAESDEDKDGKHLAVFDDGRFACVTHQGDREHRRRIFELVGVADAEPSPPRAREAVKPKPAEPVLWSVNCERLANDEAALSRLAAWRGWSVDFCRDLAHAAVIGLHTGCVCFPVMDAQGVVIGRHVFQWPELDGPKAWYAPGKNAPLIIGAASLAGVKVCNVIESQHDALSLLFTRGWRGEALESLSL